jgi:hypothetical protein
MVTFCFPVMYNCMQVFLEVIIIPDSVGRLFGLLRRNATPFCLPIPVMLGVSSFSEVNLLFLGQRSLL